MLLTQEKRKMIINRVSKHTRKRKKYNRAT